MLDLDRIDIRILELMQANGRISNQELADKVGLSATPCSRRVKRLEEEGVIDRYVALVNPAKVGKTLFAFVHISLKENILILTGHYKGVDQRIRDLFITKEISIGDYVLTGGELAAAVLVDVIVRLIPGVIGDEQSALTDSFQDNLLSPPVYTRPANFEGMKVPDVLLSGNFPKIDDWRSEKAYERTQQIRPDLLDDDE